MINSFIQDHQRCDILGAGTQSHHCFLWVLLFLHDTTFSMGISTLYCSYTPAMGNSALSNSNLLNFHYNSFQLHSGFLNFHSNFNSNSIFPTPTPFKSTPIPSNFHSNPVRLLFNYPTVVFVCEL